METEPLNIEPGDPLPPFTMTAMHPDGHMEQLHSTDLSGRSWLLFFYPEADTPG